MDGQIHSQKDFVLETSGCCFALPSAFLGVNEKIVALCSRNQSYLSERERESPYNIIKLAVEVCS